MRHYDVVTKSGCLLRLIVWSLVSGDNARGIYSRMFVVLSEEYFSRYYPTHLFSAIVIPRAFLIMGVCVV